MPEPEPVTTAKSGGGGATGTDTDTDTGKAETGLDDGWTPSKGGGVKIVKGERRLDKVRINIMSMPWDQWNDIYNEVIDPLAKEGADIHCQVIIIAQGDGAIRENTVELGIKESLSQRGIKAEIQSG